MNAINHDMFATTVSVYEPEYEITDEEKNFLRNIKTQSGITMSNAGQLYNSVKLSESQNIIHEPELMNIKDTMMTVAQHYKEEVLGIDNEIYGCANWVAKQTKGGSHYRHDHPNSLFGLVYYIEGSPNADLFIGLEESKSLLERSYNLGYVIKNETSMNKNAYKITPQNGQIVCLPAWAFHGTSISKGDRLVVAWNFFLTGVLGQPPYDRY